MMRWILFLFTTALISCATQNTTSDKTEEELSFEQNDEGEYDIIVFDAQYDTFLNSIAKPKEFYSESYYKTRNLFLVNEWNMRYMNTTQYNRDLYEVRIDYDQNIDYGYEFEYKLYNFFKFVEWKYKVNLDYNKAR